MSFALSLSCTSLVCSWMERLRWKTSYLSYIVSRMMFIRSCTRYLSHNRSRQLSLKSFTKAEKNVCKQQHKNQAWSCYSATSTVVSTFQVAYSKRLLRPCYQGSGINCRWFEERFGRALNGKRRVADRYGAYMSHLSEDMSEDRAQLKGYVQNDSRKISTPACHCSDQLLTSFLELNGINYFDIHGEARHNCQDRLMVMWG